MVLAVSRKTEVLQLNILKTIEIRNHAPYPCVQEHVMVCSHDHIYICEVVPQTFALKKETYPIISKTVETPTPKSRA
jgi:hypothetical protein